MQNCAKRDSIACNQGAELGSLAAPLQRKIPLGPKTATPPTGSLRLNFKLNPILIVNLSDNYAFIVQTGADRWANIKLLLAFFCTLSYPPFFKAWRSPPES